MTTKTISGIYPAGYTIAATTSVVSITATGRIEGTGLTSTDPATHTVDNAGTITGSGWDIRLQGGGSVTNGSATDTTASISGPEVGVVLDGNGTVTNFASITVAAGTHYSAVSLVDGGRVTNGSAGDTHALIEGGAGVYAGGAAVTLANFGSIVCNTKGNLPAVAVYAGGTVTNGSTADTTALIDGGDGVVDRNTTATIDNFATIDGTFLAGVYLAASGTIGNFGTIENTATGQASGVAMTAGGALRNGLPSNAAALIEGPNGAYAEGGATVTNFGSIIGLNAPTNVGVDLRGSRLVNGDDADTKALVSGGYGVFDRGAASTVVNFGTIKADFRAAVYLADGGDIVNGDAADHAALIDDAGAYGVTLNGSGTVTNFGTIEGVAAVALTSASETLVAEAGSVFDGGVTLAGARLDVVSGLSTFGAGLTTSGTVVGAGTVALAGGTTTVETGAALAVAEVTQSDGATATMATTNLTTASVWKQTGGTLAVATGDRLNLTGKGDLFAGTLAGAGVIAFTGGSDALSGASISCKDVIINGASVTLSGALDLTGAIGASSSGLAVAASGVTLSGGGALVLSNLATNAIVGATTATTLTIAGARILGAGQLGDGKLTLINKAGGVIDGDDTNALIINTGAATIQNAGDIDATAAGGTKIESPIDNTGLLFVSAGTLAVEGAVSGAGGLRIAGGVADFTSTFSQNVAFTGTTGVLELAKSQTYGGHASGFSKTGGTAFDLLDIAFKSGVTKASFSGTTTSGTLTVTDGTHTTRITLEGDYLSSTFTTASEGHGGTRVVDPTASGPVQRFIAHAAALPDPAAPLISFTAETWRPPPLLAGARAAIA